MKCVSNKCKCGTIYCNIFFWSEVGKLKCTVTGYCQVSTNTSVIYHKYGVCHMVLYNSWIGCSMRIQPYQHRKLKSFVIVMVQHISSTYLISSYFTHYEHLSCLAGICCSCSVCVFYLKCSQFKKNCSHFYTIRGSSEQVIQLYTQYV